jgi:CheY-like chemotaxis protein
VPQGLSETAESAPQEAVAKAAALRPQVVAMNVVMPGMDGLAAARMILMTRGGISRRFAFRSLLLVLRVSSLVDRGSMCG